MAVTLERPQLNLSMFEPTPAREFGEKFGPLSNIYLGETVGPLYEAVRRGKSWRTIERLKSTLDKDALGRLGSIYGYSDPEEAQRFYLQQLKHSNQAIELVVKTGMPAAAQQLSLLSEVHSLSDRPSDTIEWLAMAGSFRSPYREKLEHQFTRQLQLAYISAGIHVRSRDDRVHTNLDNIKKALAMGFYENPGADPVTVYSLHENDTNRTLAVDRNLMEPTAGTHIKVRRDLELRTVPGIGLVMIEDRKKYDPNTMIKALAKARNNGGEITAGDIQDVMGITFTLVGSAAEGNSVENERKAEELEGSFIDHIRSWEISRRLGKILGFLPDNDVDSSRNKSPYMQLHRYHVIIAGSDGQDISVEVMFKNTLQGWDHRYMVGKQNPETGIYDGTAHDIYDVQRIIDVLPVLYPEAIYGNKPLEAAFQRLEEVAGNLRRLDRFDRIAA